MSRTLCVLLCASQAYGHGHVLDPPSRAELCSNIHTPASEKNTNCGQIMWEPFSIEGPDGWPADGTIPAGGAHSRFPELNEQTATRWGKVPMSGGATKFTWTFNANHVTKDYTYYMTRAGWNPNAPLTRATFEDAPFCVVDGGMKMPPMTTDHTCNVPTLEGYHIILSVWDVGDTSNSFFNVIDVMFSGGGGGSPPVPVPTAPVPVPTSPATPPVACTMLEAVHCMYVACVQDPACCEEQAGASCAVYKTHYAQCVQGAPSPSTPPPTPPVTTPQPAPTQAPAPTPTPTTTTPPTLPVCTTDVQCVYAACKQDRACCEGQAGATCVAYNAYYAQCM